MRELIERLTRDKDEVRALARVLDLTEQAVRRGQQAGDFMEPRRQELTNRLLAGNAQICISWQGGYAGAERCRLVLHEPDLEPEAQISLLLVTGPKPLSHRDCLGSLLGLGLRREKIGDLIPRENSCMLITAREIADFVLNNLIRVGNQDIRVVGADQIDEQMLQGPKTINTTVASLRMDAVIAAGFGVPRSEAQKLVEAEKVKLNYLEITKSDRQLQAGDLISVRGYGRLKLVTLDGKSRKDRLRITLEKY
ncbi:MAG: RNA-binding protein [Methylocystaceae bacterium]